jgi:hypothetical protein
VLHLIPNEYLSERLKNLIRFFRQQIRDVCFFQTSSNNQEEKEAENPMSLRGNQQDNARGKSSAV